MSNTAPSAESTDPSIDTDDCVLASVTQVSYTNLDGGTSSLNVTTTSSGQSGGVYKLVLEDKTGVNQLKASGGSLGPFRYVYLVNDTPSSPADPLVGYWDKGESITLADGEGMDVDFSEVNGVLQDS